MVHCTCYLSDVDVDEEEDDEEEDAEEGYEDMVDQTGSYRHEEGPSAIEIEGKRRLQQMLRYLSCLSNLCCAACINKRCFD